MLSRRRLQKLQGGPPRWWRLVSSLLFSGALVAVGATWYLGQHPTPTAAADQPNPTVSYQGTLSYSSGSPAPDSIHTVAFSVYSAASGGTPLWSETWATSTMFQTAITAQAVTSSVSLSYTEPTSTSADTNVYLYQTLYNLTRRDQVTVTGIDTGANTLSITPTARTWENGDYITTRLVTFDGLFSARLPATSTLESIFNVASSTRLYLGVNVNGDGEMQPRKQIAYAPLAINALYLGGVPSTSFARLDTANTFATTTFTGSPGGTAVNQGGLYVNPPSPDVNQTLLGVANNGSERLRVDAEGDVFASGTLSVLGIKTTSSNPLLLYGGAADSYVQIGQAPPANYLGFNATSSDDLMVGGQITVDDIARFSNSILGSSTLVVTGHTTLGDSLVVASRATFLGTGSQIVFQSVKPSGATSNSPLYIEVASSAGVDAPIIGVTYNGEDRFRLDGDGDLFASGTLSVLAVKTTSSNPLLVYGGSATSYVRVGQSLPAAYRGFSATSSDDLFVANDLFADGSVRFDGAVWASSTLQATGESRLYGDVYVSSNFRSTGQGFFTVSLVNAPGFNRVPLQVNPASVSVADGWLFVAAINDSERFLVDGEGDVFASGTLSVLGVKTTSSNPLLVYGGAADSYVRVGQSLPAAYRGFSATSSDDLFVANDLFADGAALFDGAISASSSMQVTGNVNLYGVSTINSLVVPDGGYVSIGASTVGFTYTASFNGIGGTRWYSGPLAIDAVSAAENTHLVGVGVGNSGRFSVDAEGDVFASGTLSAMGLTGTSTDPLRVYGGAATGHVLIGSVLPAAYRGLVATSSNDLLVGDELSVVSTARFDGAIKASSTLEVTGLSRLYATTTISGTASALVMGNGEWIENSTNGQFIFTTTGESSVGRLAIDVVETNGNTTLDNLNGSYLNFADNLYVTSGGRGVVFANSAIILNSNIASDGIDFRDDENQAAPGNLVLELNGAFPILYASNTATTTIYDTLLVSSTDSFYIRSIVNTTNVASRLAFDDSNDEFIIDVQSSSTGAGPLDVAVKLDDQAAGLSYFRVRSSTTAVWSVDSTGTVGAGGSDVAERYPSAELLLPGDVVAADPSSAGYIRRATGSPGESILGVVSTKPAIILGFYDSGSETLGYDVALVGRVPVRTSDENGPISIGDLLTLGSEPGTAVRRVGSGVAIGTALEAMASSTGSVMTFINVASQPDVLEVVSSPSRSAADLKVYRFAPYAGTIEVANLVVTESIEVRGSLRVAGSLQLEGALLTEFWDTSGGQLRVGDAAAIVGPNEVGVTWADRNPAVPAIGLVAEVVPIDEVDATTTVEYLTLLAQRGQLADPAQLRRLRVAVGGTLAGFTDLVPGTRYYLATQPPYPTSGTSSQEALAAEAPTAIGSIQQLLGVARNEGSLLLYVSPQYQLNQPPPPPPPSWQPSPPSNGSPPPAPEPEQKPGDQPPELTPSASPPEPSP